MLKKIQNSLVGLSLIILTGCAPKTKSLLDFDKYKNISTEIVKIDVDWDIDDSKPIEFTIIEKSEIDYILNILFDKNTFVYRDRSEVDGGHSNIGLIDKENNEKRVNLSNVYDGNKRYTYCDTTLYDYIHSIGVNQGLLK
ncbi:MAG: hypothetical protein K6E21_03330 [Bacilli bacterium]|nr:hypothetical protein [Bacilli bacterium]